MPAASVSVFRRSQSSAENVTALVFVACELPSLPATGRPSARLAQDRRRVGGAPVDERDHFIECPTFGRMIDCQGLAECSSTKGYTKRLRRTKRMNEQAWFRNSATAAVVTEASEEA